MPQIGQGGSLVTGANIVDASVGSADLASTALQAHVLKALTLIPRPTVPFGTSTDNQTARTISGNTVGNIAHIQVDKEILLANIAIRVTNVGTTGTYKFGIFSEDGQTRLVSVTSESITTFGIWNAVVSPAVSLPAGAYWLVFLPVSTVSFPILEWGDWGVYTALLNSGVTGKPVLNGTYTCSADTMPTTLTLASITADAGTSHCPIVRFDA